MLGLATFLIVLVAFGAVAGDWAARNSEMNSLVTRIEASEAAMGEVQDNVAGIIEAYRGNEQLSASEQDALDAALRAAAAQGRDQIAAAGEQVAAVRWLIWHQEIGDAQEAYLAHNRAWQAYLGRAADDPTEIARTQDEVNSTFEAAEGVVRDAVPPAPLFDLQDRVDVIFAPPSQQGDGQAA